MNEFNQAVGVAIGILNQQIREHEQLKEQLLEQPKEVEQTFKSDKGNVQYYPIYSVKNHEMLVRTRDTLMEYLMSFNNVGFKGWMIRENEDNYEGLEELIQEHFDNEEYMYGHQEEEMEDDNGDTYLLIEWYILIRNYDAFKGLVDPMQDLQQRIQYIGLHTECPVCIALPH